MTGTVTPGSARVARWLRPFYLVAGLLSLGVGVIGIVLPLVPTTPLVLLAAYCFARSSERLHRRLTSHRRLGRYIRDFESGRGIPRRAKILAVTLSAAAFAYGFSLVAGNPIALTVLALVAVWAMITILRVPGYRTTGED
ncbi:MAG: YbaN family protein [Actinomycetota bacterium]